MKKCKICGIDAESVLVKLETINGTFCYCHNHFILEALNGFDFELVGNHICDISGQNDAIAIIDGKDTYYLSKEYAMKLIFRSLSPDEYFKLVEKYGNERYLIHDDIYDPITGEAFQPIE